MFDSEMFWISVILFTELNQLSLVCSVKEYEYVHDADGWLRLRIAPAPWTDARRRCDSDGGILASPTTDALTKAMTEMMIAHNLHLNSVFTGMHAKFWGDFESLDGKPLSNVFAPWADGEPSGLGNDEECLVLTGAGELADESCASELPYFCFTSTSSITESNICGMDNGYKLEPRTGSCYKFHREGVPWHQAAMKCASERAYLAVIDSDVESKVLVDLFARNPEINITGDYNHVAHVGFLDWNRQGQWLTVFGETLNKTGFEKWDYGEPNNIANQEFCGSVSRNGKLNDSPCVEKRMPFICEIMPRN